MCSPRSWGKRPLLLLLLIDAHELGLRAVDQGLLPPATQQTWCDSSGWFRDGTVAVPCWSMRSKFHPAPQGTVPPVSFVLSVPAQQVGGVGLPPSICSTTPYHMGVVSGTLECQSQGCSGPLGVHSIGSVSRLRASHLGTLSAVHNRHYIRRAFCCRRIGRFTPATAGRKR